MNYESSTVVESKVRPGISFVVARMSFGRRVDLIRRIRELLQKHEFLAAGETPQEKLEAALLTAEIDRLYRGKAEPKDVEAAIVAGAPSVAELRSRRFYGHLYLGLWRLARGERGKALADLERASVADSIPGYMGDVARAVFQDSTASRGPPPPDDRHRFRTELEAFAAADKKSPFPRGQTVFVGSSTIRFWPLAETFPGVAALNRGFGGSQAADAAFHAYELANVHAPARVVYYEGDNDLAANKTPAAIADDAARFVAEVRGSPIPAPPNARIVILGVKPCIRRWRLYERQRETNVLLAQLADGARVRFLDLGALLLGDDGRPRPELYQPDGLHLSKEGYRLWSERLRPELP